MRIRIFYLAVLLSVSLFGTLKVDAVNIVTLSDVQGKPEGVVDVSVSLTSEQAIYAIQVSMDLKDAAMAIIGSAQTKDRASSLSASCGTKDGITNLLIYSPNMTPINPGTGEIATFSLQLGKLPTSCIPTIKVMATDVNGNTIDCDGKGMTVQVLGATAQYLNGPVYDFGAVPINGKYEKSITVFNSGTSPLIIENIQFSQSEFICASELPLTVPSNATGIMKVAFSPTKRGDLSATMSIVCNSSIPDNILILSAQPFAVNEVHVGSVSGVSDSEVTIPITVNNMDDVTGFTFEFDLPEQLKYVDGSFELSDRKLDHSVSASMNGNRLIATAYSLTDSPFKGTDGQIASFRVKLNGRNAVNLKPAKAVLSSLIDNKVTDVTSAVYGGTVSIQYPVISTVSELTLGRTPITENAKGSFVVSNYGSAPLIIDRIVIDNLDFECNVDTPFEVEPWGSKEVTMTLSSLSEGILDGIISVYSNDPDNRLVSISVKGERYAPNSIGFKSHNATLSSGIAEFELVLDNYDTVCGLQFDVSYQPCFEPSEPIVCGKAEGFTWTANQIDTQTTRYFMYSLKGESLGSDKSVIAKIPFTFTDDVPEGRYAFIIDNVKISDSNLINRASDKSAQIFYLEVVSVISGDLNSDGVVNTVDLEMMIGYIASSGCSNINTAAADMNNDGQINSVDLEILINQISNN
ncbi:MAG: choice-of-anchor D domain-containing protein [Muribaculaceae bacterium]|nr:choice-of-anchor D domain-containing protein [Muribaculaceae bacterium]